VPENITEGEMFLLIYENIRVYLRYYFESLSKKDNSFEDSAEEVEEEEEEE